MALHRSIIRQGTSMLDKQAIKTLRTFRLAIIKEGPDLAVFAHPSTLSRLAVWLVDAVRDLIDKEKSGKPRKSLPFVVAALDEKRDSFLVVGMNGAAEYGDVRKKWVLSPMSWLSLTCGQPFRHGVPRGGPDFGRTHTTRQVRSWYPRDSPGRPPGFPRCVPRHNLVPQY
jgi:hypothetical protein